MCKKYRVSVKYKSGPLAGKFVIQVVNVPYNIGRELCEIWTETGFEVSYNSYGCKKTEPAPALALQTKKRKEGDKIKMNYEMIQNNIDASTIAAIYAKTEEERRLYVDEILYWENKKEEYINTHNVKGELLNV